MSSQLGKPTDRLPTTAVGAIIGWRIAQHPNTRVSVVCRSNFSTVKRNGFRMETFMWGTGAFVPRRVTKSTRDVQHIAFDYVVCANRLITQNPDVLVQSIAPVIRPSTVIVMTQNGVGVERPLRQAFMANPILSAICYVNCHQVSPGVVRQSSALGSLGFKIGNFDSDITIRDSGKLKVDALVTLDPKFGLIEDLKVERWTKAVINGSWNPVTAILGLETHELIATSDLGLALVQRLSEEIFHVAVACGVPLPSDLRSRVIT